MLTGAPATASPPIGLCCADFDRGRGARKSRRRRPSARGGRRRGGLQTRGFRKRSRLQTRMLKKILAKLREKITPSRASKPHAGGSHSPSPAHPRPARSDARPERGGERGSHGRGPRQERGPRTQDAGGSGGESRRSSGSGHEPRGRRDERGGRSSGFIHGQTRQRQRPDAGPKFDSRAVFGYSIVELVLIKGN